MTPINPQLDYISRTTQLLEFLKNKPKRFQLLNWLHKNLSTEGQHLAICYFQLEDNLKIRPIHIIGIDELSINSLPLADINEDRPVSNVLREMKMLVYSAEELEKQNIKIAKDTGNLSFRNDNIMKWKSAVAIPIGFNRGYSFLFTYDITKIDNAFEHLKLFESILNLFESSLSEPAISNVKTTIAGEKLSSRQELIVKMITEGKTNMQIGLALGYSESLIRQETIIIYKKLEVKGRAELIKTFRENEPGSSKSKTQ